MYVCMYECTTVAPGTHRVSLLHIDIVSDSTYSSVCGTCRACVCMYVCMYVAHLGHVYVCMYVWMDGCMYVCMYVCTTGAPGTHRVSLLHIYQRML